MGVAISPPEVTHRLTCLNPPLEAATEAAVTNCAASPIRARATVTLPTAAQPTIKPNPILNLIPTINLRSKWSTQQVKTPITKGPSLAVAARFRTTTPTAPQ